MLRAVSGVEPEAVPRRVLGEDVSTRGGGRLVGDGVRACIDCAIRRATVSWGHVKSSAAVWRLDCQLKTGAIRPLYERTAVFYMSF